MVVFVFVFVFVNDGLDGSINSLIPSNDMIASTADDIIGNHRNNIQHACWTLDAGCWTDRQTVACEHDATCALFFVCFIIFWQIPILSTVDDCRLSSHEKERKERKGKGKEREKEREEGKQLLCIKSQTQNLMPTFIHFFSLVASFLQPASFVHP